MSFKMTYNITIVKVNDTDKNKGDKKMKSNYRRHITIMPRVETVMDINNDLFIGINFWFEDGTPSVQLFHAESNEVYGEYAVDSPKMPKNVVIYETVSELTCALQMLRRNK